MKASLRLRGSPALMPKVLHEVEQAEGDDQPAGKLSAFNQFRFQLFQRIAPGFQGRN